MPLKDYESVEAAVEKELNDLQLDDANQTRGQVALALARTLDSGKDSTSGAMAQSIPSTAKQLLETMQAIRDHLAGGDDFLDSLNG